MKNTLIFSCNNSIGLAQKITKRLNTKLSPLEIARFRDGEIFVHCPISVRGKNVFLIQSFYSPVNDSIMEFLLAVDMFKRASARSVIAVIPYLAYSKQTYKTKQRVPISSRLLADLIQFSGVVRLITLDLHIPEIQGFYNIPVDNLSPFPLFKTVLDKLSLDDYVVVAPDPRGFHRAFLFSEYMKKPYILSDKRIEHQGADSLDTVSSDIKGKDAVIIDDIIDSGRTVAVVSEKLKQAGASKVYALVTHSLIGTENIDKILYSNIEKIFITDSIFNPDLEIREKLEIIDSSEIISKAIYSVIWNTSLSQFSI